ncbi:MAG TPA: hypothetical protein VNL15_02285 [Dehalococcoidia bacterium]|nr:hypothetical protein [Dehalococcoidia bacterium]
MQRVNRSAIVLVTALLIAVVVTATFFVWADSALLIERLDDLVQYLQAHNNDSGRLIFTLAALLVVVLAILVIILELAPESQPQELHVRSQGSMLIVPTSLAARRLEEALLAVPGVREATAKPSSRDGKVAVDASLLAEENSSFSGLADMATQALASTLQNELGISLHDSSRIRVVPVREQRIEKTAGSASAPTEASPDPRHA